MLASMYSLLQNSTDHPRITILTTDPPIDPTALPILLLTEYFAGADISVRYLDDPGLKEYETANRTRWLKASMLPLLIPQIVVGDRCIFLDADTIVMDDIAKLYRTELHGAMIGACEDPGLVKEVNRYLKSNVRNVLTPSRVRRKRLHLLKFADDVGLDLLNQRYFSSGVVLYDLKAIRKFDTVNDLGNISENLKCGFFSDQTRLNTFFRGHIHRLDIRWNLWGDCISNMLTLDLDADFKSEVRAARRNPGVLHYPYFFEDPKVTGTPVWKTQPTHPFGMLSAVRRRRIGLCKIYRATCLEIAEKVGIDIIGILNEQLCRRGY